MPAQYALTYYLGSTILGSLLMSLLVLFYINIPNGTLHLDEAGMVFLISCGIAMIGSLPFYAWLNWVWYKKVSSQPYEDFFQLFLRKYWVVSTLSLVFLYVAFHDYNLFEIQHNFGVNPNTVYLRAMDIMPLLILWISYVPLGWWIIKRLKVGMQPSETDV